MDFMDDAPDFDFANAVRTDAGAAVSTFEIKLETANIATSPQLRQTYITFSDLFKKAA